MPKGPSSGHQEDSQVLEEEADGRADIPAERSPVLQKNGSQSVGELRAGTGPEKCLPDRSQHQVHTQGQGRRLAALHVRRAILQVRRLDGPELQDQRSQIHHGRLGGLNFLLAVVPCFCFLLLIFFRAKLKTFCPTSFYRHNF